MRTILDDLVIRRHGPTIFDEIAKYSKLHVKEYTKHIFDKNGKLLDDGLSLDVEQSYFDSFIDAKQAAELERRLKEQQED